jgi:hypothetical protein
VEEEERARKKKMNCETVLDLSNMANGRQEAETTTTRSWPRNSAHCQNDPPVGACF